MVSPKKKSTVSSKTVVSKALHKLRTASPDLELSSKFTGSLSDSDFSGFAAIKKSKKTADGSKRKRSGSIINSIKNPFSNKEPLYHSSERNTIRTGKVSISSESKSLSRLHVPRSSSRDGGSGTASPCSSRRCGEMLQPPFEHDLSALEKGEFRREQSPLIPDHGADSTNYQSFVHVDQAPVITQGSMPMTPIPLPSHGGLNPVEPTDPSPFTQFLEHMYEKYPSYITGLVVILIFAGSMYSISTGKGTQYLTAMMKATLCWLLGSNTANLIFGDGFCEFQFSADETPAIN
ncbi:uncharacterized protein Ecym_4033 [Eremothecium cymbalariae DBVPG|uniref:Uncharacterized protein n=1 Tax=Eremothecium cymbalariae (strain CBS 270.75 / DBVPG 7215 / KCTC 17166 / NRRL Y-17582) TaxID=931890 RepID=G8JSW2_ERECY|nr:hypothetical protein Ecym_4033 [Eremothecium cymbalariae DBVPG\